MIHTAGLLHDIGKFTWPDRILKATTLEESDLATVRSHPQEGVCPWWAHSTATARSPKRSSTTTSASTGSATRPG